MCLGNVGWGAGEKGAPQGTMVEVGSGSGADPGVGGGSLGGPQRLSPRVDPAACTVNQGLESLVCKLEAPARPPQSCQ